MLALRVLAALSSQDPQLHLLNSERSWGSLSSPSLQCGTKTLPVLKWGNHRANFVCYLSQKSHRSVLSDVQYLKTGFFFPHVFSLSFKLFQKEGKCGPCHLILVQSEVSVSTMILGMPVMCQSLAILPFIEQWSNYRKVRSWDSSKDLKTQAYKCYQILRSLFLCLFFHFCVCIFLHSDVNLCFYRWSEFMKSTQTKQLVILFFQAYLF